MGADRRGPLAAFVVVAIIAAILLVTSVRSQAAPGWFRLPASSVAEVPDTPFQAGPGAPRHAPRHGARTVRHGVRLARRGSRIVVAEPIAPAPHASTGPTSAVAATPATPDRAGSPGSTASARSRHSSRRASAPPRTAPSTTSTRSIPSALSTRSILATQPPTPRGGTGVEPSSGHGPAEHADEHADGDAAEHAHEHGHEHGGDHAGSRAERHTDGHVEGHVDDGPAQARGRAHDRGPGGRDGWSG